MKTQFKIVSGDLVLSFNQAVIENNWNRFSYITSVWISIMELITTQAERCSAMAREILLSRDCYALRFGYHWWTSPEASGNRKQNLLNIQRN